MMGKIFITVVLAISLIKLYKEFSVVDIAGYDEPFVSIYGREACQHTNKALMELKIVGIDHQFFNIDDKKVADQLHAKMNVLGVDTSYYLLPVVQVKGDVLVRPEVSRIKSLYLD